MQATKPTKEHLEQRTNADWKPGDTGLVKKFAGGHIYVGAKAAERLGMKEGDGGQPFTVVEG